MANYNIQHVKLPTFNFGNLSKNEAISGMVDVINDSKSEFTDHEEIIIRYTDVKGELSSVHCIVNLPEGEDANISVLINENDTLKIVETDEEPEDKSVLWLTDKFDEDNPDDLRAEINLLKNKIKDLENLINKHEYALYNTIAGGDIVINSEKYDIENQAVPERPEIVSEEVTEDTKIVSFELCIGETILSDYKTFYAGASYYLKPKCYNENGELIDYSEAVKNIESIKAFSTVSSVADVYNQDGKCILKGKSGDSKNYTTIYGIIATTDGRTINTTDYQGIGFEVAEKPDYETYSEPNVHHMLIKTVETYDILRANLNYLCVNELIWCNGDNSLYFKAKAKDGSIQLFKINGQGSEPIPPTPTGDTTITFTIIDDDIDIKTNNTGVTVNENGYLTLPGFVNENGYLVLSDSRESTETEVAVNGNNLDFTHAEVTEDGYLQVTKASARVNNDGIIIF